MDTLGKPKDHYELQKHYQDLFTCYSDLQRDHNRVITKHKSSLQVIIKQKKEIQSLKLRYASPRLHNNRTSGACTRKNKAGGCQKVLDLDLNIADSSSNKENVGNTLGQLQTRDTSYVENSLRQLQTRLNIAEEELQTLRSNPRNDGDSKTEELVTKLHMLQAQHDLDESRIQAQAERLEKILRLHKEYTARHGALRKELHLHQEENEELEFQIAQLEECKEQVEELTHHNDVLEDKVRKLSKLSPAGDFKRERSMMAHELKEKQRLHVLLEKEHKELQGKNKQLRSQLNSAEQYFSRDRPCSTPPAAPNRLGDVWQQLDHAQHDNAKKEEELQQVHQTLQTQIAMNSALQQRLKDTEHKLEIVTEATTKDSLKAAQHLQRIQLLESQLQMSTQRTDNDLGPPLFRTAPPGENIFEIRVNSGNIRGVPEGTKSFVVLDFHTFGSKLSDIVSGTSPAFKFAVKYEIQVDAFFSCFFAKEGAVRIELYTLQKVSAAGLQESQERGVMFASASVSVSALFHPSAAIHLPRLELTPVKDEHHPAGSLSVSIRVPAKTMAVARERDLRC